MKISNHISIISLAISVVIIFLKLQLDIVSFDAANTHASAESLVSESAAGIAPKAYSGGFKIILPLLTPAIVSLFLSILGIRKGNKYRRLSLVTSILALVYLMVPVWLIATMDQHT